MDIVTVIRALPSPSSVYKVGDITMRSGSVTEGDWLICDGRTLDRGLYPELAAVLGTTYGGTKERFRIPDHRTQPPPLPGERKRPSRGWWDWQSLD